MPRYSCPLKAPLVFFWMYPGIKGVRERFGRVCVCVCPHFVGGWRRKREVFKNPASKTRLVSKTQWIFKLKHTVAYEWIYWHSNRFTSKSNFKRGDDLWGLHARQHTGDFSFISKVGFDYNKTFKWNAKNQTLGWTICLAFPTAAVKIKGIKITQHSTHSLFFVRFYVFVGGWGVGGLMLYYEPARQ